MKDKAAKRYIVTLLSSEREEVCAIGVKRDGDYMHFLLPGGGERVFKRARVETVEVRRGEE